MEVSPEGGTFFELRKEGRVRKRYKEVSESEWIQRHGDCGRLQLCYFVKHFNACSNMYITHSHTVKGSNVALNNGKTNYKVKAEQTQDILSKQIAGKHLVTAKEGKLSPQWISLHGHKTDTITRAIRSSYNIKFKF